MPTIPSVFRNLRTNDVHQRPFKAFKNYTVGNDEFSGRKFELQKAVHKKITPHVGDATYNYPLNSTDDTNQHVIWNWIDHRYYRYPYDEAKCHELTNPMKTEKFLNWNSSVVTIPYHEMGERVKPGSLLLQSYVTGSSTNKFNKSFEITGSDDGLGNLRDLTIPTTFIPSASNNLFYYSFNNEYRIFDDNYGLIGATGSIDYKLRKMNKKSYVSNIEIESGINMQVSESVHASSGLAGKFTDKSFVSIQHNDLFDEMQRCDEWTLSLWIKPDNLTSTGSIVSKYSNVTEQYYDARDKMQKTRTINKRVKKPGDDFSKIRTPMQISLINDIIHYQTSDGSNELNISATASYTHASSSWSNIVIRNSNNLCEFLINGNGSGISGSIPRGSTTNYANILFGRDTLDTSTGHQFKGSLSEVRLFNYALNAKEVKTLANNDFYTGSLYQTNVMGNIFYRNGQVVVTSPMPKYQDMLFTGSNKSNSAFAPGSAVSGLPNNFKLKYKGQYTIYENEAMVRIPMNSFNVSTNPTSTYRPASGINNPCNDVGAGAEQFNGPGEYRKTMFITGSARPYITTVGLFNDKGQMLAVGKMAEPLEKRNDIDMNIIIRWDY